MRGRLLLAVVLLAVGMQTLLGSPAAAAQCAEPGTSPAGVPWAQQRLAPESIWPVADGAGVRVAVLSSGVDASHPQLAGRVAEGQDYLSGSEGTPRSDCEGLGTQVAGVIVANRSSTVGFHGLAPKATIVPYRVATGAVIDADGDGSTGTPGRLAEAIRDATAARPGVLVVPVVTYQDDPALRSAVAAAVAANIVVVAAVGDVRQAGDGPTVPYPAAYDHVLGVGAIDQDGLLGSDSAALASVDLVAPGEGLLSTQRGGGLVEVSGTGVAAAYVAGTAALVRSRWKQEPAAEVVRRLLTTATPMSGSDGYGAGMVSPAQAVSETLATGAPSPLPSALGAPAARAEERALHRSTTIAVLAAGSLAAVALLVVVFAVALPRGRRRRWRPGFAPRPEEHPEDDLPAPPVLLFEDRQP